MGFSLFSFFILIPLIGISLVTLLLSKNVYIGKATGFIWLSVLGLILFFGIINWAMSKTELDKEDYYGSYVIHRDYFKGAQTNWQYDHFRFEITDEDSIFFHMINREKTLKTYRGIIKTTNPANYRSARLIVEMEQPTHHILTSNPTIYRSAWDFYLVFESPKFHNVFFKKGTWEISNQ